MACVSCASTASPVAEGRSSAGRAPDLEKLWPASAGFPLPMPMLALMIDRADALALGASLTEGDRGRLLGELQEGDLCDGSDPAANLLLGLIALLQLVHSGDRCDAPCGVCA